MGLYLSAHAHVQRFRDIVSYYSNFVLRLPSIATPLVDLHMKKKQIAWNEVKDTATNKLFDHLIAFPVLALLDSKEPAFPVTNASNATFGVILSQQADKSKSIRFLHVTHTASRRRSRGTLCTRKGSTPFGGV